eukprot:TRINITY_DN741_c0_g2_i1.p1 TRINITY_DN741_c0_g2~~TRINITY_DN741_c0_g2_i1.p1  ORF type:complete len:529 (-),score=64.99 TRINITY_DN741_c0_g2_i1:25-1611(-)
MHARTFQRICLILLHVMLTFGAPPRCKTTEDCKFLHECRSNRCVHKEIFPITIVEVFLTLQLIVILSFTNIAGIGGTAPTIALLIVTWQFELPEAVPVAITLVLGALLANFILNVRLRDHEGLPMIRYDIAAVVVPPLIFWTIVGIMLSRLMPRIVITVCFILLTGYTLWRSLEKARKVTRRESERRAAVRAPQQRQMTVYGHDAKTRRTMSKSDDNIPERINFEDQNPSTKTLELVCHKDSSSDNQSNPKQHPLGDLQSNPQDSDVPDARSVEKSQSDINSKIREKFEKIERTSFPLGILWPILLLWIVVLILGLLKGSPKKISIIGFNTCSAPHWIFEGAQYVSCIICFWYTKRRAIRYVNLQHQVGYESEYPFVFDENKIRRIGFFAAFGGTLVGIAITSSGFVVSMLLLVMGENPDRTVKTSTFCDLFVFSTTFILLADERTVTWQKIVWFFPLGFLGVLIFAHILNHVIINCTRRLSIILWILFVVTLCMILMIIAITVYAVIDDPDGFFMFKSICDPPQIII